MMFRFSIQLFIVLMGFILNSCYAEKLSVKNDELINLLESQIIDADFQSVLANSDDIDVKSLERRGAYFIYKVSFYDLGLNEHDFIFALDKSSEKVILLTGSLNNFNSYILPSYSSSLSSSVKKIVIDSTQLTREFYKQFIMLDSMSKAEEWLNDEALGVLNKDVYKIDCLVQGDSYICHVPLVFGQDLMLRKVIVTQNKVVFEDKLIVQKANKFLNPHD